MNVIPLVISSSPWSFLPERPRSPESVNIVLDSYSFKKVRLAYPSSDNSENLKKNVLDTTSGLSQRLVAESHHTSGEDLEVVPQFGLHTFWHLLVFKNIL